ncbi:MAG: hypothetical protein J7K17_06275 [Candidatus Omnitrophica bacterium]|nr:hypothetical protein [Candidatus Omnitrophota bacterium]
MIKGRAFTFVEVLATVVVLSLGVFIIYRGMLTSLEIYNSSQNYLGVKDWLEKEAWMVEDSISHKGILPLQGGDYVVLGNRKFFYQLSYNLVEGIKKNNLYEVNLSVSWKQADKKVNVKKTFYVLYQEREEK